MLDIMIYIILFIMGIYFGSFFTLATYRIPKGENITYKHSYCPNCNHKLGILELIPLISYVFLGGKCKHCGKKISIRYFLLEFLSGITFVLFAFSLHINFQEIEISKIVYLLLGYLYFSSLFILAEIEKEHHKIQKSVLMYGILVSIGYMIYSYTLNQANVYEYIIYLAMMIALLFLDTRTLKKNLSYNYMIQVLILVVYMIIFSGPYYAIMTVLLTILTIGIRNIILAIKHLHKTETQRKKNKTPIVFFMCISNITVIIVSNILLNYLIK